MHGYLIGHCPCCGCEIVQDKISTHDRTCTLQDQKFNGQFTKSMNKEKEMEKPSTKRNVVDQLKDPIERAIEQLWKMGMDDGDNGYRDASESIGAIRMLQLENAIMKKRLKVLPE